MYYQNMSGMKSKLDEFYLSTLTSPYDLFIITEIWFNDTVLDNMITSSNYSIFRKDRNKQNSVFTRGGGVMIGVKSAVNIKIIDTPEDIELVGDATDAIQMNPSTSQQLTQQGIKKKKTVHEALNSADLFNLYNMLNALKIDFLWTDNLADDEEVKTYPNSQDSTNTTSAPLSSLSNTKGHQRTPSLVSMTSTNSVSNLSDSDSEISNENDSGIESENGGIKQRLNTDKATELAKQCRRHLSGLYGCLEQMTDAANYLTDRYQNEIGSV
ncbi:hypothetical protein ACFFRR_001149 [Megaselia abdita]